MRTQNISFVSDGLTLEGLLHLPDATPSSAVAVCHPHPLYGGDMHNHVVTALCEAAAIRGIAALRFNFRGVGGSQGAFGNGIGERADAIAAIAHLRQLPEVDPDRLGLVGYSFGAAVALLAATPDVKALVALSTPTIDRAFPQVAIPCPVLLVGGDQDQFSSPSRLAQVAQAIGPRAEPAVVPGADHFWSGAEDPLAELVTDFLLRHFSTGPAK